MGMIRLSRETLFNDTINEKVYAFFTEPVRRNFPVGED